MNKRILSILVENTAGVLSRVSGLFSRRGYNIDSLSVGITTDPNYSRMTVVCSGDELILEQITKQVVLWAGKYLLIRWMTDNVRFIWLNKSMEDNKVR